MPIYIRDKINIHEGENKFTLDTVKVKGKIESININPTSETFEESSINTFIYDDSNNNGNGQTEYTVNFYQETKCDILIVGGGGGGGKYGAGGGGGDVQYFNNIELNGSYTVKVGKGGNASTTHNTANQNATNGVNSEIILDSQIIYISAGGGAGTSWDGDDTGGIDPLITYTSLNNSSTGAGGGGAANHGTGSAFGAENNSGNPIISTHSGNGGGGGSYGDNIGSGDVCIAAGGGGGGGPQGQNGQNAYMDGTSDVNSKSGNGGNGTPSTITGVEVYYGGGGGGGGSNGGAGTINSKTRYIIQDGIGGLGGGGNGSSTTGSNDAQNNTGGGGGGGSANGGGNGGSGIVIIKKYVKKTYIKTKKETFNYTGSYVTWNVPKNVNEITAYVWGAGGGGMGYGSRTRTSIGGTGGFVKAKIDVSNINSLNLIVAGGGVGSTSIGAIRAGGYLSGGDSTATDYHLGGSGGGLCGIFKNDSNFSITNGELNTNAYSYIIAGSGGGAGDNGTGGTAGAGNGGGGGSGTTFINGRKGGDRKQNNSFLPNTGGDDGTNSTFKYSGGDGAYGAGSGAGYYGGNYDTDDENIGLPGGGGGSSYWGGENVKYIGNIPGIDGSITQPDYSELVSFNIDSNIAVGASTSTLNAGHGLIVLEYDDNNIVESVYKSQTTITDYTVLAADATNLIAHYKFDGNGNDSSGNQKHLTEYNITYENTDKIIGQSSFHNGSGYFEISNDGYFSPDVFSISCWVKPYQQSGYQTIASCRDVSYIGWIIYIYDNKIKIFTGKGSSPWYMIETFPNFASNPAVWRHLVVVWNKSTSLLQIYVNGNLESTSSITGYTNNNINNLRIGAGTNEAIANMGLSNNSLIDDFRIYDKALTRTEIYYLANNMIVDPEYKYLTFTAKPDLVYDFTPYNDLTSWKAYADSIGATYYLTSYNYNGVFVGSSPVGYIQLVLPSEYDTLNVVFGNSYTAGTVNLYIDNVNKLSCTAGQTKTYNQTYTAGQVLKITEENSSVINGDLIITLSKTQTPYTLTFDNPTECDILIVAGGGGGGGGIGETTNGDGTGGGGGGGGLVFIPKLILNDSYTIKVGNGGLGQLGAGENGYNSSIEKRDGSGIDGITNFLALGGGGGGNGRTSSNTSGPGNTGGSGGGGGGNSTSSGGSSTQNTYNGRGFGNSGGDSLSSSGDQSGGGGGAGNVGQSSHAATSGGVEGGEGGIGLHKVTIDGIEYKFKDLFGISNGEYIVDGTTARGRRTAQDYINRYYHIDSDTYQSTIPEIEEGVYFGGGGAGKGSATTGGITYGGLGGGASVIILNQQQVLDSGINGTGGGGHGGGKQNNHPSAGVTSEGTNGGSGIVIIRYKATTAEINYDAQWTHNNNNTSIYYYGNVGIGNNANDYKLNIDGDINISGEYYKKNNTISLNNWQTNGTDIYRENGNVGIDNPEPVYKLQVNGEVYASQGGITGDGTTTWSVNSDRRIKENIEIASYEECYENLKKMNLFKFNYKEGYNTSQDINQLGFIAQEIETQYPKSINTYNNIKRLNISQLNYNLFGAMKYLINEIETLKELTNTNTSNISIEPNT